MKYDIVIIGASSAGLYAAEILAKNGKNVAVFDRATSFAPTKRTYIITPKLFQAMPEIDPDLIRHKINDIHVQSGNAQAVIQLSSPDLIVDRSQLITALKNRAENAGVELFFGSEFLDLNTENGSTQIKIRSNGQEKFIKADYLIGADGVSCSVGKAAGLGAPRTAPLLQAEIILPDDWDPGVTKVWFDIKDTPYFYWLIPESESKGVVGLIAEPGTDIQKLLNGFLEKENFQSLEYQSGQAALHTQGEKLEKRVGDLNVLLVGDAAGQVKVTTVGGTVTGLSGGRAAASAILADLSYRKTRRSVSRELDLHLFIRQLLEKMKQQEYIRLVELLKPSVLSLLSRYDRDTMRKHFWKLPFIQPAFIPLGLKLLIRKKRS
ncbi:MAG: NAD(P)/FAD-dependent oxidoreductase [Anaerolineales bacterium]|nr:NAD(P)/FAD-dependent oxidoreductase [Anaerolineales bacterium]